MNNFIQLINNLNQNFSIYLRIKQEVYPLTKITFTANECLLYAGQRAMNKKQLFNLIRNIHHRNIAIFMVKDEQQLPVYGIQVAINEKRVTLM